jgi:cellulose synthase/poly-beta-1,6-N-acetylglucosamine synthase-like glycosyltransferase
VIVPAYNEAETVADTIRSLQRQTVRPAEIIVVDDASSDDTGAIAASLGVRVVRPPRNTGSKAGAQTFALQYVRTELVLAIDADTTLEEDAIERLLSAFEDPEVAAACGFVLPRHVRTLWERGRYVEYLYAFTFFKPIQDYYGAPLISSGCFSLYRVEALRALGGWSTRTLAEDMDLTWSFYQAGWKVRFVPEAVSYPIEPYDLRLMRVQLKRWSHGFVQNVRLHWRGLLDRGFLSFAVAVACWDSLLSSLAYLALIPALALIVSPWFLLAYVLDVPAVIIPVAAIALRRHEFGRAVASMPAMYVLRMLNSLMILQAFVAEVVLGRRFAVYEKGH